jgi:hypothetical protein
MEINTPEKTLDVLVEPLPLITRDDKKEPTKRAAIPGVANLRAAVVEKKVTRRISEIGLMLHQGSDPGPPGLAKRARFGPPPAVVKPISLTKIEGFKKMANDPGAERAIGIRTVVTRRIRRWMKSRSR